MAIRERISKLLFQTGISERLRKALTLNGRFVLTMHGVASTYHPDLPKQVQPHLCKADVIAILEWLKDRYAFLTPSEFLASTKQGVLLTFDDGFANNHEVLLPILVAFEASAIFFVTYQHIKDPHDWLPATRKIIRQTWQQPADVPMDIARDFYDGMNIAQLQSCAKHPLITIGSHTLSHPFLSKCSEDALQQEILGSKIILEETIGDCVDLIAYPTGDYDRRAIDNVRQAGYTAGFAMDPQKIADFRYEIPRIGIYASDQAYLSMKMSGLHRRPIKTRVI